MLFKECKITACNDFKITFKSPSIDEYCRKLFSVMKEQNTAENCIVLDENGICINLYYSNNRSMSDLLEIGGSFDIYCCIDEVTYKEKENVVFKIEKIMKSAVEQYKAEERKFEEHNKQILVKIATLENDLTDLKKILAGK